MKLGSRNEWQSGLPLLRINDKSVWKTYDLKICYGKISVLIKMYNTGGSHSTSQMIQVFCNGMTCKLLNSYGHSRRAYKSQHTFWTPWDGGSKNPWNAVNYLPVNTASHPVRLELCYYKNCAYAQEGNCHGSSLPQHLQEPGRCTHTICNSS